MSKASGRLIPMVEDLEWRGVPKRKLTADTCKRFGYAWGSHNGEPVHVAQYKDHEGNIVAQKIRTADKDFKWLGDSKHIQLFGQHLWRSSGKMVVITEGEIDAMSVSQVQDHKWPVVSIPNGSAGAKRSIQAALEWLEQFEKVVFMFDMDDPGKKAASECAQLLSPGKAAIASLPLKDANEMLLAGRGSEIVPAIWNAKGYRPDGIVCGKDIWEKVIDFSAFESLPYPWTGLTEKTKGIRKGELVTVCAGTGVGKSEVVRQIAAYLHDSHKEVIGYVALEESVQRTALGFMGLFLGHRLHVESANSDPGTLRNAFEATVGSGRYFLYDHFGSMEGDHLLNRIRYMVRGLGCSTVVLDHISIVISGLETEDERKTIDVVMTKLRQMVEELKFRLIIICHLKRIDGTSHEEGGRVRLSDLRGSGSIAQISNMVIALERNQQSKGNSNKTTVRVLKNRHSGDLGVACMLDYDPSSGRLSQATESPAEETSSEEEPF